MNKPKTPEAEVCEVVHEFNVQVTVDQLYSQLMDLKRRGLGSYRVRRDFETTDDGKIRALVVYPNRRVVELSGIPTEITVEEQAREAYSDGVPRTSNPYRKGTTEWDTWDNTWGTCEKNDPFRPENTLTEGEGDDDDLDEE